jgi:antirestriction protein ArdC
MEELVAELGAAFLCADLELTPQISDDHAPYIASWLKLCSPLHNLSNHEVAIM